MLQGQARGKVGDLVFYVRQGQQQTRVRNRVPANPRTQSQMNQRVKLAALVGFYKRQSSFFRFALRKSQKESYYNAFVRENINVSPYLDKEDAAAGYAVPAPYLIADGDMPSIQITENQINGEDMRELFTNISDKYETWGDMRIGMGLQFGDMLTVVIYNTWDEALEITSRGIDQHVFDEVSDNMPIGYDMSHVSWDKNDGIYVLSVESSIIGAPNFNVTGAACILSRNNGGVMCSRATIRLDEDAQDIYERFRTDAARERAAASYGKEATAILDPKQFEGNLAELIRFYSSDSYQDEISETSIRSSGGRTVVYALPLIARAAKVAMNQMDGTSLVSASTYTPTTGQLQITAAASVKGSTLYEVQILDANDNFLRKGFIRITVQY